jgi:uncharacterized protein YecT (DUF1311 family)
MPDKPRCRRLPLHLSRLNSLLRDIDLPTAETLPFNGSGYSLEQSGSTATMEQIKASPILMEPCCVSLYTSTVRYDSFHYEQGWVTLQDGQSLHMSFEDVGGLLKQDIEKWSSGKELLVIYSSEKGVGLLDPKSLKSASILEGLKEHPIDLMANKCFQSESTTTAEMVACYGKGLAMWDKELNRFYGQLMASLGPAQKESVQTAQRQWLQYRDAERAAFDAVDNDGTLSRVGRAREAMRITKEQAERLARLLSR